MCFRMAILKLIIRFRKGLCKSQKIHFGKSFLEVNGAGNFILEKAFQKQENAFWIYHFF